MSHWVVCAACLLWTGWSLAQTGLQPIPALTARVIDTTGTLSPTQQQALEEKLATFERNKGTQIVVLMIPTTQPEDIVDFTQRLGDLWKIGRKDVGDGLLVVVAKNDRVLRIAPAKTLEGVIPDLLARQIIDRVITPRFKQGDFAGGLDAGIDQLTRVIAGEPLPLPAAPAARPAAQGFDWMNLLVLLFFAVPIGGRFLGAIAGRKAGSLLTGGAVGVLAWLVTTSLVVGVLAAMVAFLVALASGLTSTGRSAGWGGGGLSGLGGIRGGRGQGSWGGHGGGFRSGGGGNFGGGGASGHW